MMLAFLMYLMMQRQAAKLGGVVDSGVRIEDVLPREYPAIHGRECKVWDSSQPAPYGETPHCLQYDYTCSSPDTEILEYTVSGRAFCRKVTP